MVKLLTLVFFFIQALDSSEQLGSLTKNRVRPPSNRRPPSRQRSSSPSPRHQDSAPPHSTVPTGSMRQASVTRVAGITGISADSAMVTDEPWPDLDASAIKLQWVNGSSLHQLIGHTFFIYFDGPTHQNASVTGLSCCTLYYLRVMWTSERNPSMKVMLGLALVTKLIL